LNKEFRDQHAGKIDVKVMTIDVYVREHELDRVDVIKVDVECMEHVVLEGARDTLNRYRPVVFLEVLSEADCEALNQLALQAGYMSVRLGERLLRVRNEVKPDPGNGNQLLWPAEKLKELKQLADKLGYHYCRVN
jgi:hypothetical protein